MGLRRLISKLDSGETNYGDSYPNHNTPDNVGGFNYGQSISIFDANQSEETGNQYFFPFNQRSLGYGPQGAKDTTGVFGRLYGPAPFIKQRLPDLNPDELGPGDSGPLAEDSLGVIDAVTDVGVRGGLVTALKRSAIDAARIGEFLLSARGLGFIAKNVGLQASNPRLQEGAGRLGRNRLYNLGVNTLAQTLTAATGLHVNRAGLLPIGKANYRVEPGYRVDSTNDTKYEYHVRGVGPEQKGGTGNVTGGQSVYKSNRLTALYNRLLNPFSEIGGNTGNFTAITNPELYEFKGGPHSVYGIGKTRLKRYVFTARDVAKAQTEIVDQPEGYKISRHLGSKFGPKQTTSTGHIIDFRKNRGLPYTMYDQKLGEGGDSIEKRFGYARGIQRVGSRPVGGIPTNEDGTINVRSAHLLKDRINSTDIWVHEGPWDTTKLGGEVRDYIKFRIEAVDTDTPKQSSTMVFRAFLDSMDDNYSSKWNEYNYNGRAEPFYTFGSFNRSISFSFKVAAFSRDDMRPMYRKLNYLVSQTAGEYKDTRLRGNFCRLTIGDYHSRLPGFFTSINLKWNKDYPWEIAMYQNGIGTQANEDTGAYSENPQNQQYSYNTEHLAQLGRERAAKNNEDLGPGSNADYGGPESTGRKVDMDSDMLELPHILDVSCNFQPIHDFIPQKSLDSPFIIPNKYSKPDIKSLQEWLKVDPIDQTRIDIQDEIAAQEEKDLEADIAREEEEERLRKEEERKRKEEEERKIREEEERKFQEEMERMMEEEMEEEEDDEF